MKNDYKQQLLDLIAKIIKQNVDKRQIVYLEGGYYNTRFGPQEFSINTLTGCIDIAEKAIKNKYKVTRIVLGVLANNIGITCDEDSCSIPDDKNTSNSDDSLPKSLQEILNKSRALKNDQPIFTNERTLRNRGIRIARQMLEKPEKYSLTMDEKNKDEALYSLLIEKEKIPLIIKKGKKWVARCPLIMGQHYSDLYIKFAKKYGESANQLLVDMSEMYDRHKVNNGARVALFLLKNVHGYNTQNLKIANFIYTTDDLKEFEYDLTEGN